DVLPGDDRETLIQRFHDRYEEIYGYSLPWRAVEILECHLRGSVPQAPPARLAPADELPALENARIGDRRCYMRGSWEDVPVYRRELLHPGHAFAGPALIDSRTSTILVPESFDASVDEDRNVILHLRDATGVPTSLRAAEKVGA